MRIQLLVSTDPARIIDWMRLEPMPLTLGDPFD
jgi:hypothetical protein